ncbi:MAG TPA: maleylpyruvate isomerase N-terminal domain-containing protein [Candidatus Dormibacteraeota bacterium]|nr:maleylpyruvate isomerase N-terminal domain-containing protein [Candidatus Dormibacteraeota bacterium]
MTDSPLDPMGRPVPTTTADLVGRVEEAWAWARPAVERVARDGLDRPTSTGWTYRALALHVAAWHELTVERLGAWLATAERPAGVDVDAFNASVARQAASTSDEEVLRRLDASYATFLDLVRGLPTERLGELDAWPVVVVAANSYGHYEEHSAELGAG